ncbi:MAG TPA: ABC transporter permease [Actinomycetota bacterium]|nr:ABC transporter permease [Actinomycetota bacterium]
MGTREAAVAYPAPSFRRARKIVRRNLLAYKHFWIAFVSGFFEPLFYLVAVGFGVGRFVGSIPYGDIDIDYATFLAPGMLAASTLNASIFDGFFAPFFKLNWMKTYDGIVTTPMNISDVALGEIMWALIRATIYGAGFLCVMVILGLVISPWGILALPAVMLCGAALASGAMVLTGITKQISSLEKVMTLVVFPLFLFSGTFFPVSLYPAAIRPVVQALPVYHAASLLRGLTTGQVTPAILWHVAYLVVMAIVAGTFAARLMRRRLVS